jgi:hypothetical protein
MPITFQIYYAMGTIKKQNKTTIVRCDKDEQHPFNLVSAKLYGLNGYQLAIMAQILSNKEDWNIVKSEIGRRLGFPRLKFNKFWKSLIDLGYISVKRIQGGYDYTIFEDPGSTSTRDGICEDSTSTTGRLCAGGMLTNTNNNYNRVLTNTTDGTCHETQFNELLGLYPNTGDRSDGTTYTLKGKLNDCKKAYIDYIKTNGMTHEEIMTALKVELNDKQMTGRTRFQPGLLRWIEDKTFEQFRGRTLEPVEIGYGQELI